MDSKLSTFAPAPKNVACGQAASSHKPLLRAGDRVSPSNGYVTFSPRIKLVTLSTVRAVRGTDAETAINMVDNFLHEKHIRFAFNIGLHLGGSARDFRFFATEIVAPELVKKFTIEEAIVEILGNKDRLTRTETEIAWTASATQIGRLIKAGFLELKGNYLTRASLEAFLFARWSGNNPT